MRGISGIILRIYRLLLWLYPGSFRDEFAEQMLLDFSDMAVDTREKGKLSFVRFCLREFVDFPFSLLKAHWGQGPMFKVLRSQPVNYGLRSALGFGVGFALITLISVWISNLLSSIFDPLTQTYSVWYWDTFRNERWIGLLDNINRLLSLALTGLFFGLLFALLTGNHRQRRKYLLAGSLAWFIPNLILNAILDGLGWSFFLNKWQISVLGTSISVLVGAVWGAGIGFAGSDRKIAPRYLIGIIIVYPLAIYLFIRLLFYLWFEITAWFFICLMLMMIILIASVIVAALLTDRKILWTVIGGAIGYRLLSHAAFYISFTLLRFPMTPLGVAIPPDDLITYQISDAAYQAVFGILLGLTLGLIFGYQSKKVQPQLEGI